MDDIDLYIGCLFEKHLGSESGALMGPTALCITANQFQRTKNGDRFFYDIGNQPNSFTPGKTLNPKRLWRNLLKEIKFLFLIVDQLTQIRQSSFARLICDNNDGSVTNMQPLAMKSPAGIT